MDNSNEKKTSRRDLLKSMAIGGTTTAISLSLAGSYEEQCLAMHEDQNKGAIQGSNSSQEKPDGVSGATRTSFKKPDRGQLKSKIPLAKLGNVTLSRIILGGNLIGGYAHSRDLIYVSELVRAYHTQNKCIETFMLAEECGINAFLGDWNMNQMMLDYWKWTNGKIQLVAQCPQDFEAVKRTIDCGAVAMYLHGETCDRLVKNEQFDVLEKFLTLVRDARIQAGLGSHRIETLKSIAEKGIKPDFWMKTYHPLAYWSARHAEEHDNVFCRKPDDTKAFMETRSEPWIAFKTLAAGAVMPNDGFKFAMEGGADFLCVGMYDFQIVRDINIYNDMMATSLNRKRRMLDNIDRQKYEEELERLEEVDS